ncbi:MULTISPECIES: helix-turn-helix domain-containing protein [Deinococcus]|uniref:Multiprotein-bridging factor 1 family protein n=1 Tax=Deinococcus rufus TaxID=2136097 RepID=A0ABV7Z4Y4_9DEIO|nr:XRE family transcriptional regulator [Deinococcus sp. AB2017081]WQE96517.1 XRE family transcriptional regulator [Deinococcus sp. AB2017081]
MESVPFPGAVVVRVRRQLLGIGVEELAAEAGLDAALLQMLERGEYDPRSLHPKARAVLERRLDITL